MNLLVVDTSVWLEIFTAGEKHKQCEQLIQKTHEIIVPTLVLYEVYKKICIKSSDEDALSCVSFLQTHQIQELTSDIAILAADLSIEYKIAMADSIVLAHARINNGTLLTLDNDFRGIPGTETPL